MLVTVWRRVADPDEVRFYVDKLKLLFGNAQGQFVTMGVSGFEEVEGRLLLKEQLVRAQYQSGEEVDVPDDIVAFAIETARMVAAIKEAIDTRKETGESPEELLSALIVSGAMRLGEDEYEERQGEIAKRIAEIWEAHIKGGQQ